MTSGANEGMTALVLRDGDGTLYVLDEQAIRACRATPEQEAALNEALPEQEDVSGFLFTNVAGLSGTLFMVTQAEMRETGAPGLDLFRGPVRATGVFVTDIAPAGGGLRA